MGEKRGKVDVGAKARAAPGTSRLPVRERGGEGDREARRIKASLVQRLTRLASSAHR